MDEFGSTKQTKLHNHNTGRSLSIHRKLFRAWPLKSHNHTEDNNYPKRNKHNKHVLKLISLCLTFGTATPSFASDIGGVSATANPVANSSGSVTNQAIQVLQGPYITNTYGNGLQCQGATMNVTPYITGTGNFKRPFEHTYMDPVYDVHDANDDGQIDNPGNILYYVPTRTGQQDSYNLSVGLSATWSRPLDKEARAKCMEAVATQINLQNQIYANKRLDFELARLKNCGELMKAGIVFHPKSQYAAVCADVMLINPPGTLPDHTHTITPTPSSSSSQNLKDLTLSIGDID